MDYTFRWALVDIQTTGLHIKHDKITEIAIWILTENGIEKTWHRLLTPQDGQAFETIAEELILLLQDAVLVAHNARLNYGFLKNAFKEINLPYQSNVLCTIKLFKTLYPLKKEYTLQALAIEFGIESKGSHRTLLNLSMLFQLLQCSFLEHYMRHVLSTAKLLYKNSSLPSKLKTNVHAFPEIPGVYLFFSNQSKIPLYIGKSVNLRQRILSHFQSDYLTSKEFLLSQQVERVEIIPTAGELSALILESTLIKEQLPLYNRRLRRKKEVVGFRLNIHDSYLSVSISREKEGNKANSTLLGAFSSMHAAKVALLNIVKKFELCSKLSGMEIVKTACFNFQLKRCKGACIGVEPAESYNKRVMAAFEEYHIQTWPFRNAIAIKEYCETQQVTQFLIFNQWRCLGILKNEEDLKSWAVLEENSLNYYDTYKILSSFLKQHSPTIIELE
jgi:DNA polymerase-3 subunit epsilon